MNSNLRFALPGAVAFTIFVSILFFLPGSALPKAGWMATVQVDKWIHVGIFFLLCVLWIGALKIRRGSHFFVLAVVALLYGCLVEWVQDQFVANRSLDPYDVLADAGGIGAAYVWWRYIKK